VSTALCSGIAPIEVDKKVIDENKNKVLNNVLLLLKIDEVKELRDLLDDLIKSPTQHGHLCDYEKDNELTICCYGEKELDEKLSEEIRGIIYKKEI
jgi:hypothetical protein